MYLKPDYPFNLILNLDGNSKLTLNVEEGDETPELQFCCIFFSTSGGRLTDSSYSVDSLVENTVSAGIDVSGGITINKGIVNIGTSTSSNHAINIGTGATGARGVSIGNNNSGSTVTIHGAIETPNPTSGVMSIIDVSGSHSWVVNSHSIQRIGKVCCLTINATVTAEETMSAGDSFAFFAVSSDFITAKNVVGPCTVDSGISSTGCIRNVPESATFNFIPPMAIMANGSVDVIASVTYIA